MIWTLDWHRNFPSPYWTAWLTNTHSDIGMKYWTIYSVCAHSDNYNLRFCNWRLVEAEILQPIFYLKPLSNELTILFWMFCEFFQCWCHSRDHFDVNEYLWTSYVMAKFEKSFIPHSSHLRTPLANEPNQWQMQKIWPPKTQNYARFLAIVKEIMSF